MAAAPAVIVLLSLLLISWRCHAEDTSAILLEVVDAVEKLIGFYKASHQHLNLDGFFGLNIVEGQIQGLLDEHRQGRHPSLSPSIVARLATIVKDSQATAEQALATVRHSDGQYFQDLAFIIAQPWTVFKKHRKVTPSFRWEIPVYKSSINAQLIEDESDECMMELRPSPNASSTDGESGSRCRLTERCTMMMTKRGLTEYGITHQILWTALGELTGCGGEVDRQLSRLGLESREHMQEEWCTNVYYEMLAVVHVYMSGTVKSHYQDIFMEQQFVCPNLGFYEFLKKKYLDQILSWQLPSGCFGDNPEGEERSPSLDDQNSQKRPHSGYLHTKEQGMGVESHRMPEESKGMPADSQRRPVIDSQRIPVDSQRIPVDSQRIPVDSQRRPVIDSQRRPVIDSQRRPVIDSQRRPVDSQRIPVDSQRIPVDSQRIPVDSQRIPVDSQRIPVDSQRIPVVDSQRIPVVDSQRILVVDPQRIPVDSQIIPVDSQRLPVVDSQRIHADVNSLDVRQQQLSQQLKELQSSYKDADRLGPRQPGSKGGDVDVLHQQLWETKGKKDHENRVRERNAVPMNQGEAQQPPMNSAVGGNNNRLHSVRERSAIAMNIGRLQQQPPVKAEQSVVGLPGSQNKPAVRPARGTDQKRPAAASLGRERELANQHAAPADANLVKPPQMKYSSNQGHINQLPVKGHGDYASQMNLHDREEQRRPEAPFVQNSDSARKAVSFLRLQGRSPDVFSQNVDPGVAQTGQQSNRKPLDPYLTSHGKNRRLLVEKRMPGGCLSHKTSVATGALVMYLRYLVDPGPLDLSAPHDFFPNTSHRSLLGSSSKTSKDIANFLSDHRPNGDIDTGGGGGGGGKGGEVKLEQAGFNPQGTKRREAAAVETANNSEEEEEDEDEEDDDEGEDAEYDDNEELYPDGREEVGQPRERRVVHFGANNDPRHRHHDDDHYGDDNINNREDEYADETDNGKDEEDEEGDYINRVKAHNKAASLVDKDTVDDDTEYTYYDDDDDTDRGIIIKRHKPQIPPLQQKGARIRTHNRHRRPHPPSMDQVPMGLSDAPPTKMVVVLLSATSLLLIVFMYRFIRKRRVPIRHTGSRGYFKL